MPLYKFEGYSRVTGCPVDVFLYGVVAGTQLLRAVYVSLCIAIVFVAMVTFVRFRLNRNGMYTTYDLFLAADRSSSSRS